MHIGQSVRFSTVNNYTSAINSLHRFYGYEIDFRSYFVIKMVLKGLKVHDEEGTMARVPFTMDQLGSMYDLLVKTPYDELCWLSVLLCVRTLLRKSNVLPDKLKDPHVMKRDDVQFSGDFVIFTVHSTKTRRKGDEALRIPVKRIANYKFCLYTRLYHHFQSVPSTGQEPVILKSTHYGPKPLMYRETLEFLKAGAERLGIDHRRVGLHSLRRSGAMHLYSLGVTLNDIRLVGDWRSLAVLIYLSAPLPRMVQIEELSASALNML